MKIRELMFLPECRRDLDFDSFSWIFDRAREFVNYSMSERMNEESGTRVVNLVARLLVKFAASGMRAPSPSSPRYSALQFCRGFFSGRPRKLDLLLGLKNMHDLLF